MSGIAAVLNLDGSSVPSSEVDRMVNVLKPHGPHRQETLLRGNAGFAVCLQHLTPEDLFERQPLLLANRMVMLFDGRVDNRSELSNFLGISVSEQASMSDSMIALRLFDRWGERGLERIVGVFAIIIMDFQDGQLVCARDHMGLRGLHYFHSGKRFAVATIPEALFALHGVPLTLNKDKVADTLVRRGVNSEATHYQDIYRVLSGSVIRVRNGGFSKGRFWDPESISDVRLKSDQDYVEAFQERLDIAVKSNLRSIRAPCAGITGGLDSSSIAVIAADILAASGCRLNTFTAVPEVGFAREESGLYFNETPYVRQIAEANPNIVPHFVPPNEDPILEQISEQIRIGGYGGCVLNGLWNMDLFAAARSAGHNVMLGGDMGNHTMSYNGRSYLTALLLKGRWVRLFSEIRASDRWRSRIRHHVIGPVIPAFLFRRYKKWRRRGEPPWYDFSALHPVFADKSGVVDRTAREYLPFDAAQPRDGRQARIMDLHCFDDTADWLSKVRAGFQVDYRTPAFDRRLVEFCFGIPEDQYLRGGRERWLIRRAMTGRLPDVVLNNKKRGLQAADWYPRLARERSRIMEELKRLTANPEVASIIDLRRLIAILDNWPDRQPSYWSSERHHLQLLPEALGAAYFVENVTGANYGRSQLRSPH